MQVKFYLSNREGGGKNLSRAEGRAQTVLNVVLMRKT